MRLLIFVIVLILSHAAIGQNFYKSTSSIQIDRIRENGIVYVKTDAFIDSITQVNLESYWTACSFKIYDPESNEKLDKDQVVLIHRVVNGEVVYALVEAKQFTGEGKIFNTPIYLNETVGFFVLEGFRHERDTELNHYFAEFAIKALNTCVEGLLNDALCDGKVASLCLASYVLEKKKSNLLKNKTLLLIGGAENYFAKDSEMDNFGIKYKRVSKQEFKEIIKDDKSSYCLLYGTFWFEGGNGAIFDLETAEMIYYRRFQMSAVRMTKSDWTKITETF